MEKFGDPATYIPIEIDLTDYYNNIPAAATIQVGVEGTTYQICGISLDCASSGTDGNHFDGQNQNIWNTAINYGGTLTPGDTTFWITRHPTATTEPEETIKARITGTGIETQQQTFDIETQQIGFLTPPEMEPRLFSEVSSLISWDNPRRFSLNEYGLVEQGSATRDAADSPVFSLDTVRHSHFEDVEETVIAPLVEYDSTGRFSAVHGSLDNNVRPKAYGWVHYEFWTRVKYEIIRNETTYTIISPQASFFRPGDISAFIEDRTKIEIRWVNNYNDTMLGHSIDRYQYRIADSWDLGLHPDWSSDRWIDVCNSDIINPRPLETFFRTLIDGYEPNQRGCGPATDLGLPRGKNYIVHLRGIDNDRTGNRVVRNYVLQNSVSIASSTPAKPTNLVAIPSDQTLTFTWDSINNNGLPLTNTQYRYRHNLWSDWASLPNPTQTSIQLTELTNGLVYEIQIKAFNQIGEGPTSDTFTATPADTPSKPTNLSATPTDQTLDITWDPINNGGSPLTQTQYRHKPSTSTQWPDWQTTPNPTQTTLQLTGLTNGQSYDVQVRGLNQIGEGPTSDTLTATPADVPSIPPNLSATPTNQTLTITWDTINNEGNDLTQTQYRHKLSSQTQWQDWIALSNPDQTTVQITGLNNGQTYDVQIRGVNQIGEGTPSDTLTTSLVIIPLKPANLVAATSSQTLTITWNTISNGGSLLTSTQYRYRQSSSSEWPNWTALPNPTQTSVQITGLTNRQPYQIQVRGVNSIGEGLISDTLTATPATIPSKPINLTATPSNQTLTITWDPIDNGGGLLTSTQYRYRHSSRTQWGEWVTLPSPYQTTIQITGLTNGEPYQIQIKGINSIGEGPASDPLTTSLVFAPLKPTNLIATPSNQALTITWDTINNGGRSLTSTQYRYRALQFPYQWQSWTSLPTPTQTTAQITELTNGQTYQIQIRGVNSIGSGAVSNYLTATPVTTPSKPTNLAAIPTNQVLTITWDTINNGGSSLTSTQYRYRQSTQTQWPDWTPLRTPTRTSIRLTGLTNGYTYEFQVRSLNRIGEGPTSDTLTATPADIPSKPANLAATPTDQTLTITWDPINNGGSPLTSTQYRYRQNTQTQWPDWTSLSTPTRTSIRLTRLTNGQPYQIQIRGMSQIGEGTPSDTLTATPADIPSKPANLAAIPTDQTLTITWDPINNGGSPLTKTQYRYKQSTQTQWPNWQTTPNPTQTTLQLTGLTNGQTYLFQIRAVNEIGDGRISDTLTATPVHIPSKPTNLAATPTNQTLTITWDPITNGGSPLTKTQYRYKRSSETQWPDWTNLPTPAQTIVQLTGLTNGHPIDVQVRGVNAVGEGAVSDTIAATPATTPSKPINLTGTPSNQSLAITWDTIDNGGSPLTKTQYRYRQNTQTQWPNWRTLFTPTRTSIRLTGLTNGQLYQIQVRGVNSIGKGLESQINATPKARVPGKPLNFRADEVRDSSTTLCWDPIEDYESQITSTQYRYKHSRASDSGWADWITMGYRKPSCYRITGLSNGIAYDFQVRAVNSAGAGSASDKVTATPISSPTTPEITRVQPGDSRITLYWRVSDEGSPLTDSSYRFKKTTDRNRRWSPWISIPTSTSTSHTVRALTNDVSYDFQIRAENRVGTSNESRIRSAVPGTSNPIVFIPSTPSRLPANTGIGGNPSTVNLIVNNNTVIIGENITVNFGDTDGNTHEPNIVALADMGVTRGCNPPENTRFCPDRAVTRAEMATFLVRAFELEPSDDAPFKDTTGNVHRSNINSMAAAGISVGCNPPANTLFCPDRSVTRAEMATFMTRVLELDETGNTEFGDTQETIHATNINRLATAGISQGCNPPHNTRYCPNRAVTRGEMATFLVRSTSLDNS